MWTTLRRSGVFLAGFFVVLFAASIPKGMVPHALADLTWGTLSSLGLLALTGVFLRQERRRADEIGLRLQVTSASRLLIGLLIGAATYAGGLLLISLALGPLTWSAPTWPSPAQWLLVVASFVMLSCMEELGFRAYLLRTLTPVLGIGITQGLVAVAFGLSHLVYGWPLLTVLMGVIPSALLFGAAAWRSRGLALPIGVHAGVNLAQWVVGEKETAGVWTLGAASEHSARLAAGAPWIATGFTLTVAAVVWYWPHRHGPPEPDRG